MEILLLLEKSSFKVSRKTLKYLKYNKKIMVGIDENFYKYFEWFFENLRRFYGNSSKDVILILEIINKKTLEIFMY